MLTLLLACRTPEAQPPPSPPTPPKVDPGPLTQILLISVDTLRADHLGAWGDERGLTPALDSFAQRSLRFSRAHAHAPWTKPSMGALMTSVLPRDHGVITWYDAFGPDQVTLPLVLQEAGWSTEAVVSSGAFAPGANEFERGFDHFELSWPYQDPETRRPEQLDSSALVTDLALAALERLTAEDEPFFLWVHYLDPHRPYLPHEELEGFEELAQKENDASRYAIEVAWTDLHLGRLLERAEQEPELGIVFLADHGEELGEHGGLGHGHTLYDELVHVPLMLQVPGVDPGVDDTPVGLMDVAPTLLSLAELPPAPSFQGRPLLPAPGARPVLFEVNWRANRRGVLDWPYKLSWDLEEGRGELFDLEADPRERNDLWEVQLERANALQAVLAETWPEVPATR